MGNGHFELLEGRHQCGGLRYKSKVPRARGSLQQSPAYSECAIPQPLRRDDQLASPRDTHQRPLRDHLVSPRDTKEYISCKDHLYHQRKRSDHQPPPSKIQRSHQRDHQQGMVDHQSTTGTSRGPPPGHLDLGDTDEQKAWRQLVGQRVCISGVKQGTLRYFGRTNFAQGHWCGIELDEPVGKNDGTVSGVVYFACRPNHGIFAPVGKVSRLNDAWKPDPSENDQNDLASSSSWRSKEPSCDPKYWEFNLDESTEKKFIKNSISDPTFMQGNVKAAIPRGSESFSFDKRDFVESSKTYAKSSVKHSSSSRSLSKYGYSEKNQYLRSNVITQGNNISQIQSKKHNNENGSLTNTMEPYEKFLKTPTNSGQASPTSSENPVGKRFNEMPLYDYGKMPDTFLNSFQPNDFSDFEDEVDNDDQMSVDYDESLGILTPSQMKELTMGSDFPTSLSDIRGLDFPSSESFDDINDLPEDEQVHDVSVFRVSEPSTARILQISKQNGASHYNKNIKGAIAEKVHKSGTDKFLCSKSPNNVENFNFDPRFTSTASEEFRINSIDNFSHTYNVKDITTANVLCSEKASNSDEQITEKYYMYSKEESSNVLRMQSSSELHSNVNIAQLPEADHSMMDIDQKSMSSSNQSDNKNSKEILENEIKLCQTVDTLHSVELESNTTLKEKLTVSWEDCLSRDSEIFQPVERPESVYTIGSSDTGFHEDGESEVGMTTSIDSATDEAKRFSSASRDSCIIVSDEADVYKIAESNSTSGYSTGLSDSCCNDRDDLSSKPLTDEEVQDSVEHCDSEDAFSFQENSLGQDGDMVNMETSDITTENVTAVDNKDSTSDALCETMVEDSTLTEINELLMSPEDKTLKSPVSGSNEMEVIADQQQLPMKEIVKQQDSVESKISADSPAQSTPERRSNTTRTRLVTSTQNTSTLNRTSRPSRDEVAEKKRQQQAVVPKSPKKNVMSKIKAMIEATSCKNVGKNSKDEVEPTVSTRRTASAPKKSRWDAVTSKIAASLAEEKTKPKTRREIKSRVNTNLTSVRQQPGSCKAPNLDSGRASNCGDGTMSPASVCSRDKRALVETKSAPNSLRESRSTLARDSKQRPKSPRPGGRLTSSRCASPDVAASESSTSASLRSFSHNSKSKTASHWKGSNSTIASSVPPANKRPPPLSATKSNSSTTRSTPSAARPINKKPPATVPKIRITFSDRSQSPAPPKKIDRTKRHTRSSKGWLRKNEIFIGVSLMKPI
ncbi:hypothetical protein JTE90_000729 [Oedothorax gibbosus]|uniref:CAP-Gly domain-containing protein n=1 Tax=Oedothorax gibbosus TaxID=931172 RepID=A0AAV6UNK6_9ARAC|nr:hypothetical protein JTE90_000729 [Oedothorax gibbosus]